MTKSKNEKIDIERIYKFYRLLEDEQISAEKGKKYLTGNEGYIAGYCQGIDFILRKLIKYFNL